MQAWTAIRLELRLLAMLAHCVVRVYPGGIQGRDISLLNRRLASGRKYVHHERVTEIRDGSFGIISAVACSASESSRL